MNSFTLCLFIVTVYTACAVPLSSYISWDDGIEFTNGEGKMRAMDFEAEPDMELLADIQRNPANNRYLLYTRNNPANGQTLLPNNINSILSSYFNPANPVEVIVHDFLMMQESSMNPSVTRALLATQSSNVIVMDWRELASSRYITASGGVPDVGRGLGQFLAFLNQVTGAPLTQMHLIGFGLGAHVVGFAGRELGGKVARISALDPAGPLWYDNKDRVNPDDALFVEAIHTNGGPGGYGIGKDVGDSDIYVNGGKNQPGCISNVCNHNHAWKVFIMALSRPMSR